MNIIQNKITYEIIHKFGLTELLNVYKQDKKNFLNDWNPYHAYRKGNWVWNSVNYYSDKDSNNWIYEITGYLRYLLYFEGIIYELEISSSVKGNSYAGGDYSICFKLKNIKALEPKDKWKIIPIKQINQDWESFRLEGDDFWAGEIPYEKITIDKNILESVKQYFKEALYSIEITRLNNIVENIRKNSLDFSLNINIEMKW